MLLFLNRLPLFYVLSFCLVWSSVVFAKSESQPSKNIPIEDIQKFSTAIHQIKTYYVHSVKDKKVFEDAIRGMLSGLDPHSAYLDEEDFEDLQMSTHGEFGGIGIEVTMEEGFIKVITPLDDTPAFKAGLKPGDYIIKLNHTPVRGLTLRDAVNKMRGEVGTALTLTVARKGETNPLEFSIKREKIHIQSVKSELLGKHYGYIRLTHFQTFTSKDLKTAIASLKKEGGGQLRGLILDLRNNPGGLLDSAIQVSDLFIDLDKKGKDKLIVYTKGRLPDATFKALTTQGDILNNAPIVVLINGGSASAAEIVAGALKDTHRAILIGTRTFGKGSVQTVLPLDGKSGIKLTTALYYTPSGTSIQAKGITPDLIVEERKIPRNKKAPSTAFTEADLAGHLKEATTTPQLDPKDSREDENLLHKDYQLYEALNVLKGMAIARE